MVLAAAPPASPGTEDEALAYAIREEESPEVQGFTGGHVGVVPVIVLGAIFLLFAYLLFRKEGS
jgi:hypothetical protein